MKVLVVALAVIALGFSAPHPRKLFHEHFDDFMDIIFEEAGEKIDYYFDRYLEFDDFWTTIDYMATTDFKDLIYEMEALPEFKAVVDFLEKDNIDITYFLDMLNDRIEIAAPKSRLQVSGTTFSSFINDCIAVFPKNSLQDLFDQKMEKDVEFRTAIENLQSEEWERIWTALWENETFQKEAQILSENGIELRILLNELMAVFGQN